MSGDFINQSQVKVTPEKWTWPVSLIQLSQKFIFMMIHRFSIAQISFLVLLS